MSEQITRPEFAVDTPDGVVARIPPEEAIPVLFSELHRTAPTVGAGHRMQVTINLDIFARLDHQHDRVWICIHTHTLRGYTSVPALGDLQWPILAGDRNDMGRYRWHPLGAWLDFDLRGVMTGELGQHLRFTGDINGQAVKMIDGDTWKLNEAAIRGHIANVERASATRAEREAKGTEDA